MNELRECPFCGSEGHISSGGGDGWTPHCSLCDVGIYIIFDTWHEAAAAWNRRARTPLETELLVACEAAIALVATDLAEHISWPSETFYLLTTAIAKAKGET